MSFHRWNEARRRPARPDARTPDATSIRGDVARFTEVLATELERDTKGWFTGNVLGEPNRYRLSERRRGDIAAQLAPEAYAERFLRIYERTMPLRHLAHAH